MLVLCSKGTPARWRDFHSATIIGTKMFVFGGRADRFGPFHSNNELYCNMIRVFETVTNTWLSTPTTQPLIEGRRSHSACKLRTWKANAAMLTAVLKVQSQRWPSWVSRSFPLSSWPTLSSCASGVAGLRGTSWIVLSWLIFSVQLPTRESCTYLEAITPVSTDTSMTSGDSIPVSWDTLLLSRNQSRPAMMIIHLF